MPDPHSTNPWLSAYFHSATSASCPACAAPLTTATPTCPRCRRHLTLALAAAGTYRLAWALALACLLLIVGISIIVDMALIIRHGSFSHRSQWFHLQLYAMAAMGLLALVATLVLLRGRKRFCAWPALARLSLVISLILLVALECLSLANLDN